MQQKHYLVVSICWLFFFPWSVWTDFLGEWVSEWERDRVCVCFAVSNTFGSYTGYFQYCVTLFSEKCWFLFSRHLGWFDSGCKFCLALFSSVQSLSHVPTLCYPMDCSTPGLTVHHQLPEFTQTHVDWVSDAIQPSHPVVPFSSCLQSFPASGSFQMSQLFASGGQSIGVSASTSGLPMNIQDSFPWIDWLDLLAVQGTLKSLLQHHSSKASILLRSAFFIVQLSHPYMTTGKTIALTRRTFLAKYYLCSSICYLGRS